MLLLEERYLALRYPGNNLRQHHNRISLLSPEMFFLLSNVTGYFFTLISSAWAFRAECEASSWCAGTPVQRLKQQMIIYHGTAEHLLGPRCALALFYRVAGGALPQGLSLQLWQWLQCVCLIYTSESVPAGLHTDVQEPAWSAHASLGFMSIICT